MYARDALMAGVPPMLTDWNWNYSLQFDGDWTYLYLQFSCYSGCDPLRSVFKAAEGFIKKQHSFRHLPIRIHTRYFADLDELAFDRILDRIPFHC